MLTLGVCATFFPLSLKLRLVGPWLAAAARFHGESVYDLCRTFVLRTLSKGQFCSLSCFKTKRSRDSNTQNENNVQLKSIYQCSVARVFALFFFISKIVVKSISINEIP